MRRLCSFIVICLALLPAPVAFAAGLSRALLEVNLGNGWIEGTPLNSSAEQINLLTRDGSWLSFSPSEAQESRKLSGSFRAFTARDLHSQLQKELGATFEISSTRHFVVAAPRGGKNAWADRLEDLYGSFTHYFSVRGFSLPDPDFQLIAIVWPNKATFRAAARNDGAKIADNVLGYYSQKSNRIMLYEVGGGESKGASWQETADTIIHEATHQTAFNVGIHSRYTNTPQWVAEGLATMFEAPGVYDSRTFTSRKDRINRGRLLGFQEYLARRKPDSLATLVGEDTRFKDDSAGAYAEAWALTFFLVETQPRDYNRYLQTTAARPAFRKITEQDRLADFTSVFGNNFKLLDARFTRFMAELK